MANATAGGIRSPVFKTQFGAYSDDGDKLRSLLTGKLLLALQQPQAVRAERFSAACSNGPNIGATWRNGKGYQLTFFSVAVRSYVFLVVS
jgi:hypothetical protein